VVVIEDEDAGEAVGVDGGHGQDDRRRADQTPSAKGIAVARGVVLGERNTVHR